MLPNLLHDSATPERLYREKYAWLLRWALHFCGKDRAAAEDLVQDVFMQMLVSWPTIAAADEPEKLLYTYLKYAFLLKCRRDRRYAFQTLSVIDFESVHLSLRRGRETDPLELQDGLRRIVHFLNFRKLQTKSASVLLLRFFHGFFPSEIMQIARLTRRSVDTGLAQAREESKAYLADPTKLQVMHRGAVPIALPMQDLLHPDELVLALRSAIFDTRPGACLPEAVLRQHYAGMDAPALDCELLAHVVSCPKCLDLVCRLNKLTLLRDRSPEEAWGFARREKSASSALTVTRSKSLQRSIRAGEERYRFAFEHRPKALMVVVDGKVVAARDVSSFHSELQVELNGAIPSELIEIMSEQELPLITMPFQYVPGAGLPMIEQETVLAGGQKLTLRVSFVANGLAIELRYLDPFYAWTPGSAETNENPHEQPVVTLPETTPSFIERMSRKWNGWRGEVRNTRLRAKRFIAAAWLPALVCAALLFCCFALRLFVDYRAVPTLQAVLDSASKANTKVPVSATVATQKLRIKTSTGSVIRELHRDLSGKRRPANGAIQNSEKSFAQRLASADISWDDPLSVANFRDWHDHARVTSDRVQRTASNELTLTSRVSDPELISESVTLREADMHMIARSIEYRDREHVEIAELDYQTMPMAQANPTWFETTPSASERIPHPAAVTLPRKSIPVLTDLQLDSAELAVRLGLSDVKADNSERLQIERMPDGIHIEGLVADDARKQEIASRLRLVPHATVQIHTFAEFEQLSLAPAAPTSLRTSVQQSGPSPLETMLAIRGTPTHEMGRIEHLLFESTARIAQSSHTLDDLGQRFRSHSLSSEASANLVQLKFRQQERLLQAIDEEKTVLGSMGIRVSPTVASGGTNRDDLAAESAKNSRLCTELISQSAEPARAPELILQDLATTLSSIRIAAAQDRSEQTSRSNVPPPDDSTHQR